MQESEFPRGGTTTKHAEKVVKKTTEHLFDTTTSAVTKTKKKKTLKKQEIPEKEILEETKIVALTKQNLTPGTLLLGMVSEIHDYNLRLSLPHGLLGNVELTGISSSYSQQLQGVVAEDNECDPVPLSSMFVVGQTVTCMVVKLFPLLLTLNPSDINKDLRPVHLHPGRTLTVAVQSIEEHGYVLETGVPCLALGGTLSGFMPLSNKYSLVAGQLIDCQVLEPPEGRSVKLGFAPTEPTPVPADTPLLALIPGNTIEFTVTKVGTYGLHGQTGSHGICVHQHHCSLPLNKYSVGQTLQGTALYIQDFTKQVYVRLGKREVSDALLKIQIGQDLEGKVQSINPYSIILLLPNSVKAMALKNALLDTKEPFEISQKFHQGNSHKCRVCSVDLVERMVKVTLKPSVLAKKFLNYHAIKPGDHFKKVKVEEHKPFGIRVLLSNNFSGLILKDFMHDKPTKTPFDSLPVGSNISCRVVEVKPKAGLPLIFLTTQTIWLNWKGKVPQSMEDVEPGMSLPGSVVSVTGGGLLVVSFSGIKGWVSRKRCGVKQLEKHFTVGQAVLFAVLNCNKDGKLIFTLVKETAKKAEKLQFGDSVNQASIVGCADDQLTLKTDKNQRAILPVSHLSDHAELCQPLMKVLQQSGTVSNLRYFVQRGMNPILTRKPSLLNAETLNVKFSSLSVGQVLPGVVKDTNSDNIFVDLGGNFVILVPKHKVGAGQKAQGLSTEVLVTRLEEEKQWAVGSMRLTEVWQQGHAGPSVDYLASYLEDLQILPGPYPGTVVPVTVDSVTGNTVTCSLEDGRTIQVKHPKEHLTGKSRNALVVASEPEPMLLLDKLIIDKVLNYPGHSKSQAVKTGQIIRCQALAILPKYVLAILDGHAAGRLVFIPTRRHLNDMMGRGKDYSFERKYHVVIKKVTDKYVIGVLKQHDKDLEARLKAQKETKQKDKKKRKRDEEDVKESSPPNKKMREEPQEAEETAESDAELSREGLPNWADDDAVLFQIPDAKDAMEVSDGGEDEEMEENPEEDESQNLLPQEGTLKWLQKMAAALDKSDVALARMAGRQGLEVVTSDKDKRDLWLALVNLELLQDCEAQAELVAYEAQKHCEPLPLLTGLLHVFQSSGHKELADNTVQRLLRKCRNQKQAWVQACQYYMSNKDLEAARALKLRCKPCLKKKEYVEVMTKIGQLEFQYGDPEQGKTLLEAVLAFIPGRLDVGILYLQLLAKHGHIEYAKQFMSKLDSTSMPQKKKDTLRKKWDQLLLKHNS